MWLEPSPRTKEKAHASTIALTEHTFVSEASEWRRSRVRVLQQLLRTDLSYGAKLVWTELAFNWAWNDPVCFPNFAVIAEALSFHRNSISRWVTELVKADLLVKRRGKRGYEFTLADSCPVGLVPKHRVRNRDLVAEVRGHGNHNAPSQTEEEIHAPQECITEQDSEPRSTSEVRGDAPQECIDPGFDAPQECMVMHSRSACDEDDVNRRQVTKRSLGNLKQGRTTLSSANQTPKVKLRGGEEGEGSEVKGAEKQRTYEAEETQPEDPSDLMEDPQHQHPKAKRKLRGPSSDLVALSGDGLRTASKPPDGVQVVEASPPPPKKPEDVLALLRGEIEAKYGARTCRLIPLTLTGKEKNQVKSILIRKYAPDVVISMVRVLVWDWEVARTACFPFRPQVKIPTIEALVQYQETLSSTVDSGFKYDGTVRGNRVTYASRYLVNANPSEADVDPF